MKILAYIGLIALFAQNEMLVNCSFMRTNTTKTKPITTNFTTLPAVQTPNGLRSTAPVVAPKTTTQQALSTSTGSED